jgi:hypothetical protein
LDGLGEKLHLCGDQKPCSGKITRHGVRITNNSSRDSKEADYSEVVEDLVHLNNNRIQEVSLGFSPRVSREGICLSDVSITGRRENSRKAYYSNEGYEADFVYRHLGFGAAAGGFGQPAQQQNTGGLFGAAAPATSGFGKPLIGRYA